MHHKWQQVIVCSLVVGLAAVWLHAAPSGCWIIDRAGRRVIGVALTAEKNGTLHLQLQTGGPVQTFKLGSYRYAYIPKPVEIARLERLFMAEKNGDVEKQAPSLFEKYKFLGWGDHVAYLRGGALLRQSKPAEALKAFDQGKPYTVLHGSELLQGRVEALIALDREDDARRDLASLAKSDDHSVTAFVFNARGKLLAKKGKKKDAVLEYLKTLLLFKPGDVSAARKEARTNVVALLKEMKDPRAKEFENFK